jgi:hypothetical protein
VGLISTCGSGLDGWCTRPAAGGLRLGPGRPRRRRAGVGSVTVAAGMAEPYLFLWGRRPFTDARYAVTGDHDLLAHWRRHAVLN